MTPTPIQRVLVAVAVVAVLLAAGLVDRSGRPGLAHAAKVAGADGPHVAPASAVSTSWLCPGGPGNGNPGATQIMLANAGDEEAKGTITVYRSGGAPIVRTLTVPPASQFTSDVSLLSGSAPWVSAVVTLQGGRVAVEQYVYGPGGFDTAACSATASAHWYFASGSTAKDATQALALFNPFPDDAIVDLAFATTDGYRLPGDYQGLVVSAQSVRVISVGEHVRREDAVSTEVRVRAGRLAADQFLVRTAPGVAGLSLTLGQPSLATAYSFPDGLVATAVVDRFELFNPGTSEAQVEVSLGLERNDAEPFELTVPGQGRVVLSLDHESRVPKNDPFAAVVASTNGVPVAVTRVFEVAGSVRIGRADTVGATGRARSWLLAVGMANAGRDEWVEIQNPNSRPATVTVTALDNGNRLAVEGLQAVTVPAGRRVAVRLGDHIKRDALALEVTANEPVVVERSIYAVGGPGLAASLGVPLD